jgi:acyl-lipid omega-6 desaturase (Delta-12 desaturase)
MLADPPQSQNRTAAVRGPELLSSRSWQKIVAPYACPDHGRACTQLLNTGLPFLLLIAALTYGARTCYAAVLPLAVPAIFLLVRLFIIQHDCGHGSFFASRWANDLLGRAIGVLTLTPYAFWRKDHAIHHATSGNLDRRGIGDITMLTLSEYLALPPLRRFLYRAYRHPLVLFGLGPIYLFFLRNRIPIGRRTFRQKKSWASILGTNLTLMVIFLLMLLTGSARALLLAYLPVILLAASIGTWMFYVQHQFEQAYWAPGSDWDFHAAALAGSSFYDLPAVLHWLTGYIGFHHVHHICSKIPNYRLRECFDQNPEFHDLRRLSLRDSLKCARLCLWDEERQLLVPLPGSPRSEPPAADLTN